MKFENVVTAGELIIIIALVLAYAQVRNIQAGNFRVQFTP